MKLLLSRHIPCTVYTHAPCHFMQSHICKVYARLAATCHLHFWQNLWDFLCATVVTRGGTDTEIGVSTVSWPWRRFKPTTFQSWVQRSNHWAICSPFKGYVSSDCDLHLDYSKCNHFAWHPGTWWEISMLYLVIKHLAFKSPHCDLDPDDSKSKSFCMTPWFITMH